MPGSPETAGACRPLRGQRHERVSTMSADFFRSIKLALPVEQYRQLPRNAAFKYELIDGETWLTPRPRWYHAVLDLKTFAVPADAEEDFLLRPLEPADWNDLPRLFAAAFRTVQ